MIYLKQSGVTPQKVTVKLVDSVDGYTPEAGITAPTVTISKNKGNFTALNAALVWAELTGGSAGIYTIQLDATDTGTIGELIISVVKTGCRNTEIQAQVLAANVFDGLYGDGTVPLITDKYEPVNIWYVDVNNGSDSNSGHTVKNAKKTINAVVTLAANGDTIYVLPGVYEENVEAITKTLSFIGMGMGRTSKIVPTSGVYTLRIGVNSSVKNMTIDGTLTTFGLVLMGDSCIVDDCWCYGILNGISGNSLRNLFLKKSYFKSVQNGGLLDYCFGTAEDSTFETAGESVDICHALNNPMSGIYRHCKFMANGIMAASNKRLGAVELDRPDNPIIFSKCIFDVNDVLSQRIGEVFGLKTGSYVSDAIILEGCTFRTIGEEASTLYDIDNYAGKTVMIDNCQYDTAKVSGTIIDKTSTIAVDVAGLDGEVMRGTDNANTVVPDAAGTAAVLHEITDGLIAGVVEQTDKLDSMIEEESSGNKFTVKALEDAPTAEMDADELHNALDSYTNKDNFKADVSALGDIQEQTDKLDSMITEESSGNKFTVKALEDAPTGGSAPTKEEVAEAVMDAMGIDENTMKILKAWAIGKWRSGAVAGTYEILDPDDGVTVILTITPSTSSPQKTVEVEI